MFALVFDAVRARTAQVLAIFVLTTLAAAVAAAGPWYASASATRAAEAQLSAATAGQRNVSIQTETSTQNDAAGTLRGFADLAAGELSSSLDQPVRGIQQRLSVTRAGEDANMAVAYRDDFCRHVRLDGPCPSAPLQIAISNVTAQNLGLETGDELTLRDRLSTPFRFTIVARYSMRDPADPYWSNPLFRAEDPGLDPVFTPVETFDPGLFPEPTLTYDVQVPPDLIRGDGAQRLGAALVAAETRLNQNRLRMITGIGTVLERIAEDRDTVRRGVLTAGLQTLILTWFAIGIAGRCTGRDRRTDLALLKLRGVSRGDILRLAWGQHLVPLLLGVLAGAPAGLLLAVGLAGPVPPSDLGAALSLVGAAVAAVLLGSLLVLILGEALVLRQPVAVLLQRSALGRADWRSTLVDQVLAALAAAAVYQARSGGSEDGLKAAAPALAALAVALLAARLLVRVADRAVGVALRAGRLRLGLTAVQVSRQRGVDRVFALIVVAVASFATAAGGLAADRAVRADRSAAELGAARVLTVDAPNRTALLAAVRRADPGGREAMAVVADTTTIPRVLAVDTPRLAAVAEWRPEYGPVGLLPDATAAGLGKPLPMVTGDRLTLRTRYEGTAPISVELLLQHEGTGLPVPVDFGVLGAGESTVSAPAPGCATAPGCRLVRWGLTAPGSASRSRPLPPGTVVTLQSLRQDGPAAEILDPARFGDIGWWRPAIGGVALDLATAGDGLRLSVDRNELAVPVSGTEVWASDTSMPLPVVLAGEAPAEWRLTDPLLNSFGQAPARVAGTAPALPALGTTGILVDLDATRRLAGESEPPGEFQVWLSADARPGLVADLTAAGLTVITDDSAAQRAGALGRQGPSAVARFALLAGVAALLLAAATTAVAVAVDRPLLRGQLEALRRQGLPAPVAVTTGYAGTAALVLAGLSVGVFAASLVGPLTRIAVPPFTDGWAVLPPPATLSGAVLALSALAALGVLGATGWLSVLPLLRSLRAPASAPPVAPPPDRHTGGVPAGAAAGHGADRKEDGR
ncbi:FtsX-like permease family protein [Actinoplanes sp. NPDC026670]|uniref:FtsX-like permease family protein n=1 Tax=Actinoplanes sp. NPDC026670 TaxID=3154700 RepID=UPI0033D71998